MRYDMKRRLVTIATLCTTFAMAPSRADAQVSWYQVPGQPLWVDAGVGWRVSGDGREAGLKMEGARGGRIEVYVAKNGTAAALLAQRATSLEGRYPGAAITLDGESLKGTLPLDKVKLQVVGTGFMVDRFAVTIVSIASKTRAKSVAAQAQQLQGSIRHQWARPGGGDLVVPGTELVIRQPEKGWQSKTDGRVLRLVSAERRTKLEVRAEFRANEGAPTEAIERWSKALLPPEITWEPAQERKFGGLKAWVRRGTVDVQGTPWTAVVCAVPHEKGAVVLIATEQVLGGASRAAELTAVIESIRVPNR